MMILVHHKPVALASPTPSAVPARLPGVVSQGDETRPSRRCGKGPGRPAWLFVGRLIQTSPFWAC
jgi:hypothetical protein